MTHSAPRLIKRWIGDFQALHRQIEQSVEQFANFYVKPIDRGGFQDGLIRRLHLRFLDELTDSGRALAPINLTILPSSGG